MRRISQKMKNCFLPYEPFSAAFCRVVCNVKISFLFGFFFASFTLYYIVLLSAESPGEKLVSLCRETKKMKDDSHSE